MEFQELFKMISFSKKIYLEFLLIHYTYKKYDHEQSTFREKHFTFYESHFDSAEKSNKLF